MATRKPAGEKAAPKKKADAAALQDEVVEAPVETVEPEVVVMESADAVVPRLASSRMVVFYLEGQRFALPIDRVQEIQQIVAYTDVPDETGIVLGMVNLRGVVVPLVDMRRLVGLSGKAFHLETPMIICRLRGSLVALVVDSVEDVAVMPQGCLQSPSKLHALAEKMLGVCRMDDGLVFLLDLESLIPEEGLGIIPALEMGE